MASSGSLNTGSYEGRYLQLSWTQTKDVANNRSTIKWTLSSIGGSSPYYSIGATTVKINGTQVYYKDRVNWDEYAFPAAKGSVSGTTTINHASDGTGSISVEISTGIYVYAISTVSNTWSLDTIPRASTPTLSASSVNMGSKITIYTNRATSAFGHTIRYAWGSTSGTIATGVDTSYTWTVPTSFANSIPNAKSGTVTLYVDTYNGSTKVGTKSITFTANVPNADWTKPKINSVTVTPSGNPDWVGTRYVQLKTKARVVTSATGQASATIKSCQVTIDGSKYTGTDITSNAIGNSGTVTATIVVTDSRGYTNSTTKNISVEAYSKPYIANHSQYSKVICARCDDNGTLKSNGTRLRLVLSKKWSALTSNVNTAIVEYQINSNSWATASAHTVTSSDVAVTVTNFTLDVKQTYKVNIRITDKFGETETRQFNIPTEEIAFNLREGGSGAAFGKYAEEANTLESAWKAKFSDSTTHRILTLNHEGSTSGVTINFQNAAGSLGFIGMIGSEVNSKLRRWNTDASTSYIVLDTESVKDYVVERGTSSSWNYVKWNSGKAEAWQNVSLGTVALTTSMAGGVYSGNSYMARGLNFPSGLFAAMPLAFINAYSNGYTLSQVASCSTTQLVYRIWSPYSATVSDCVVSLYVIGKWK